jgi:hypothetical protein
MSRVNHTREDPQLSRITPSLPPLLVKGNPEPPLCHLALMRCAAAPFPAHSGPVADLGSPDIHAA